MRNKHSETKNCRILNSTTFYKYK